jgi:hypothetical protein
MAALLTDRRAWARDLAQPLALTSATFWTPYEVAVAEHLRQHQ